MGQLLFSVELEAADFGPGAGTYTFDPAWIREKMYSILVFFLDD